MAGDLRIVADRLRSGSAQSIAVVNSLPVADVLLNVDVNNQDFFGNAGLVARYQSATGDHYVGLLVKRTVKSSVKVFAEIHRVVAGVTTVLGSIECNDAGENLRFQESSLPWKKKIALDRPPFLIEEGAG